MSTLLSSIEHITRSRACRIAFRRWGSHLFGGKPPIEYSGIKPPAPIHHILTLDTYDRHSPIRFEDIRYVPLVFPLAYSMGGGAISYQVVDDQKIKISHLSKFRPEDPSYMLLDSLPERRASLIALTYAERRILGSDILDRSLLDRWRMRRLWNGECFRVAGMLRYEPSLGSCPAKKDAEQNGCTAWRFAHFPASKRPFGDIWHEYSSDVWFCFALCFDCGTIHAFMDCT
ncbi:MAG: hypothetical protein IPK15_11445 [Verrucomicrobia bacterium]|nr:hypothetical protein [Verrucomicrobiota bacterium]